MESINKQTWVGTKEKFLQLPEVESNRQYYITDLATYAISNQEMELATTTEASLYDVGDVFICYDQGNYLKGHIYKFTGNSWEDISKNNNSGGLIKCLFILMVKE